MTAVLAVSTHMLIVPAALTGGATWSPSLAGTLLIGAVLGLLVFAFSYALRVVSARRLRQPGGPSDRREGWVRLAGIVLLAAGVVAGGVIFTGDRAVHGTVQMRSRDLFSVMPRVGLFPEFVGDEDDVAAHDPVVRFLRVDDVADEISRLEERRRRLQNELELIEVRPLALDAAIVADFQKAERAINSLDTEARSLVDEQAVLARELNSRMLERDSRRLAIEKELRALDTDLDKMRGRLAAADVAVNDAQSMLSEGLISRRELGEREHELETLRNALQGLKDQRYMLEMESAELDTLYERAESSYEVQLALRAEAVASGDARREDIIAAYRSASTAMEKERVRASQQRDLEAEKLRADLRDLERKLENPLGAAVVSAPWGGRVGYRDPSPMSRLPGQGPLLVMYRPGTIWAELPVSRDAGITTAAECAVAWTDPSNGRRTEVPGRVLSGPELIDGETRVRVACDPPAAAVARLAMSEHLAVDVVVKPDVKKGTQTHAAAALLAIPAGLVMMLRGSFARRDADPVRPAARPVGGRRAAAAAARAARGDRVTRRRRARGGMAPAASVAAGSSAMEYRPVDRPAHVSANGRLLNWLPSAICAHDLPRQVMARLESIDTEDAVRSDEWDDVAAPDVRAAALAYLAVGASRGLDTRTARRLASELDIYCDLVDEMTEIECTELRRELLSTLNGVLLAQGLGDADRDQALGGLREMRGQA